MPSTPSAKIRIPINASRRYAPVCCCCEFMEAFMAQLQTMAGQACGSVETAAGSHSLVPTPIPVLLITTRRLRKPVMVEWSTLMQLIVGVASTLGTILPKPSKVICVAPSGVVVTEACGDPSVAEYTWIGLGGDGSSPSMVSRIRQPPVPTVGSTTRRASVLPRTAIDCACCTPLSMPSPALRICELPMNLAYMGPASMIKNAKIATAISISMRVNPRSCIIMSPDSIARAIFARGPARRVAGPAGWTGAGFVARLIDGVDEAGRHAFCRDAGRRDGVCRRRLIRTRERERLDARLHGVFCRRTVPEISAGIQEQLLGSLPDVGQRCRRLDNLGPLHVIRVARQRDRRENADDRDDDHHFDQRKPVARQPAARRGPAVQMLVHGGLPVRTRGWYVAALRLAKRPDMRYCRRNKRLGDAGRRRLWAAGPLHPASGAGNCGAHNADAAAVGEHDMAGVQSRLAQHERAHLQRAIELPREAEAGIRHIIAQGGIGPHRNAVARRTFDVQDVFRRIDLAALVRVDEHDPPRFPAARVGALVPIDGLAQVDAKPALDRFAARQIQGFGKKLCMVRKLSAGDPMAVGRYRESHDQAEQADA